MGLKNRRLRVMAGPNGSGKSTILKEVQSQFYCGPFVNADEIEIKLKTKGNINLLNEFGLKTEPIVFEQFLNSVGISWKNKAESEGNKINVQFSSGHIHVSQQPSAYDAAFTADFIRQQLLIQDSTFTFETVLSHKSKIEFLKQSKSRDYKNYLYFICTIDPTINTERIKNRVLSGGHSVPEQKIEKRYFESLSLLADVIPFCYRAYFFDNSTEERSIDPIAEIDRSGNLNIKTNIPWWLNEYVIEKLYQS